MSFDLKPKNTHIEVEESQNIEREQIKKLMEPELDKVLLEAKNEIASKVQDATDEFTKQIQTDKIALITIFGIFVSITSFLTIEFQFLKTILSFEKILGFTLVLAALLLGFNVALDYLVKSRLDKGTPKPHIYFTGLILGLFAMGIVCSYRGNEEPSRENHIYQRYADDFENKIAGFHKEYNEKLRALDATIQKLDDKIENMKINSKDK